MAGGGFHSTGQARLHDSLDDQSRCPRYVGHRLENQDHGLLVSLIQKVRAVEMPLLVEEPVQDLRHDGGDVAECCECV